MMISKFAEQSDSLSSHAAKLDRIDTAVVEAAKAGTTQLPADTVFGALSDASIASSDAIDTYRGRAMPESIRSDLVCLNVAITNLAASLKLYVTLGHSGLGPEAHGEKSGFVH